MSAFHPLRTLAIALESRSMAALKAEVGSKVGIIESHDEGAYFLLFDKSDMTKCERDYLQDDIDMAKRCGEDFGIPRDAWVEDLHWTNIF